MDVLQNLSKETAVEKTKSFYQLLIITCCFTILLLAVSHQALASQAKVLAKIGDKTITDSDVQEMVDAVPERFKDAYMTPEGKQKTLDYLVNIYVLAAEAEKTGLDKAPEVQRLLNFTNKDILARVYLDKMTKNLSAPTEQDALKQFENNKSQYVTPETVHLHHILVQSEKEAKTVLDRLKKGEKFADIAGEVSICPSKLRGGDLDWLPRGSLVPEIEEVAFSAKSGQITGPVKSQFGYHIVYVEDKKPPQENSFEQVKDYIIEQLKFQQQQEQYEQLAENLRKKMNVQILPTGNSAGPQQQNGPKQGPR
jgi:peptidyl-prolyl cis-trans isomerase C